MIATLPRVVRRRRPDHQVSLQMGDVAEKLRA